MARRTQTVVPEQPFMPLLRPLTLAACITCLVSVGLAQPSVSFKKSTSTAFQTPTNEYAVDLNNDGITDVLQDTGLGTPGFTISFGNGDGTFKGAQSYTEPSSSNSGTNPLVTADFNNDGKVDIAAVLMPTNQIDVYFNNGTGNFSTSHKISTINLPAGWHFGSGGAAAADFNGDGKQDLVAWATNYTNDGTSADDSTALYVMQGDGTGGLANPRLVLSGPAPEWDFPVFIGDFDADGKADIAASYYTLVPSDGFIDTNTVHVLYGNGDFTFADTTPYTQSGPGGVWISAADLNGDGLTDLAAISGGSTFNQHLVFLYGQKARTFKNYSMAVPNGSNYELGAFGTGGGWHFPQFALGDFNGDGRMDLVTFAQDRSLSGAYLYFLLGTSTLGQYSYQVVPMGNIEKSESNVLAGLFGASHRRPDVALNMSQNASSPPYNHPSTIVAEINQDRGAFGPCNYPKSGQGFNVCAAGTASGSSRIFHAAVNSFGNLRKIELWVDGKKVAEQHHAWEHQAWFNYTHSFAAGTHKASLVAADVDNRLQKHQFSFTVQ